MVWIGDSFVKAVENSNGKTDKVKRFLKEINRMKPFYSYKDVRERLINDKNVETNDKKEET